MIETQAQRTLVKSPPELWAEVSDPSALGRHLAQITTEIRITRMEPERSVAWEGDGASGRVELAPSGWGTKVMLTLQTVAREQDELASAEANAMGPTGSGRSDEVAGSGTPAAAGPEPSAPADAPALEAADETVVVAADASALVAADETVASAVATHATGVVAPFESDVATQPPLAAMRAPQDADVEAAFAVATAQMPGATQRSGWWARLVSRLSRAQGAQTRAPHEPPTPDQVGVTDTEAPVADAPPAVLHAGVGRPRPVTISPGVPAPGAVFSPPPAPSGRAPGPLHRGLAPGPVEHEPAPPLPEQGASALSEREVEPQHPSGGSGEVDHAQASAALAAMLDSLGSAHHRPFSRS